jgi:NADP-dependent alcohol dehydrogenase
MFYSYMPTRIMNGVGSFSKINKEILGCENILILHGNSFKKFEFIKNDLSLYFPNANIQSLKIPDGDPSIEGVYRLIQKVLVKSPFILAVGGGRVIDFSKALSVILANDFSGNEIFEIPWESWGKSQRLGVVVTRPGSGSEYNNAFILTDQQGWKKSLFSLSSYPEFCIHDPIFFNTLTEKDFLLGAYDALIHVLDQYVTDRPDSTVVDELSLGCLRVLGKLFGQAKYEIKTDFQSLAWISSLITSSLLSRGVKTSWVCHEFVHAYSSLTNLSHGLALVNFAPRIFSSTHKNSKRFRIAMDIISLSSGYNAEDNLDHFTKFIFSEHPAVFVKNELSTSLFGELKQNCPSFSASQLKIILFEGAV